MTNDLERIISCLDTLYEAGDDCVHPDTGEVVSDGEYDALRRQLAILNPKSKVFNTPTTSTLNIAKKIQHDPPMTSISKASHEDRANQEGQLFKWLKDCIDEFPERTWSQWQAIDLPNLKEFKYPNIFYQSYKLDGVAIAIYYENGKLIKAGLRPRDGINGEDVTEQVKYVNGIPQELKLPITCSIRGELICKLSDFEQVQLELSDSGEKVRANPRNHTAGGIRQFKDPSKVKDQRLSFIGHGIEGIDNPPYKTEIERAKWCNKNLGVDFTQVRPFNFYDLQEMEDFTKYLDYEVDGVVIGIDNLDDQEQIGRHGDPKTGNPKGKIAWKFAEERAKPIIKSIEWKTGRTGAIKPVAIFDAVPLAGTQVRRATLHNLGFIHRNGILEGTQIIVLKAGKIIPKVVGVVDQKEENKGKYIAPKICPSCGCLTTIDKTPAKGTKQEMTELMCRNKSCLAQNVSGLCHYLATFGVLGLGESKVATLVDGGAVSTFADFYRLDVESIMDCGLSERQALLMIGGIYMISSSDQFDNLELNKKINIAKKNKISIPMWKLFASFGIESAGKSAGKVLVDHFHTFDKIRSASADELAEVNEIGEKTAQIIYDWLKMNEKQVDDLLQFVEPESPKVGKLTGQTFVLTGGFPGGKKKYESLIEEQGGKCGSSVSKTTKFVVEGTDSGEKAVKAKKLGIPLISVGQLEEILNGQIIK